MLWWMQYYCPASQSASQPASQPDSQAATEVSNVAREDDWRKGRNDEGRPRSCLSLTCRIGGHQLSADGPHCRYELIGNWVERREGGEGGVRGMGGRSGGRRRLNAMRGNAEAKNLRRTPSRYQFTWNLSVGKQRKVIDKYFTHDKNKTTPSTMKYLHLRQT